MIHSPLCLTRPIGSIEENFIDILCEHCTCQGADRHVQVIRDRREIRLLQNTSGRKAIIGRGIQARGISGTA
jgi:hypothetical protein